MNSPEVSLFLNRLSTYRMKQILSIIDELLESESVDVSFIKGLFSNIMHAQ
jgi:hypothetical protein